MRIFSVSNAADHMWVAAPDRDSAAAYAASVGLEEPLDVTDVTDSLMNHTPAPGLKEILAAGVIGTVMKRVASYTLEEIRNKVNKGPGQWFLLRMENNQVVARVP